MSSNAIASYLKNLGASIKYAATEVVKDQMPVSTQFVSTNQDVFKDVYKTIQDARVGIPRLSTIQNNVIFKSVGRGLENIKSDVMSGKFYHPEREDPMASMGSLQTIMGALGGMGDEFKELMDILGGDFGGEEEGQIEQHPEYMITKGDALVSATLIRSNAQSTNAIGKLMTRLSENRTKTTKAIADMQMMQGARSLAVQQHGFNSMAQGFNALIDFNNQIMRIHVQNSTKFYQTMTDLSRDTNATLHAIHDIQETLRNAQSPDPKGFKSEAFNIKEMFKGGLNLRQYTNMVKDNIKKSPMFATYSMVMALPFMLEQLVANPMHALTKGGISALMGAQLQVAMQRLDKTIAGAFSTAAAKLFDFGKQNSNTFLGKVAQIFGFKQQDKKLSTVDASKYHRGNMSWNGIAQKSLVEVIPAHLRRIEAALTGQGERLMNFETGKWTSAVAVKKYERNLDNELTRNATDPIARQMKAILGSNRYSNPQQRRQMSKAIDEMMRGIYSRGYVDFEDINLNKNNKYGNEGLVQLLAGVLRSMPTHELTGVTTRIGDAKRAKGNMIQASGGLENYGPAAELISGGLQGSLTKRSTFYKNAPGGNFGIPLLTELTDSRGYTLYDYQSMILDELRLHRTGHGRRGGGKRGRASSGRSTATAAAGSDDGPPGPQRYTSDPADKARRAEAAFEYINERYARRGLGVGEGSVTIDLDQLMKNPKSKESQAMIAQVLGLAKDNRQFKDDSELAANSSFLDGMLGREDGKASSSSIIDQLLKANSVGEKFDVIQKNIGALATAPATLLAGVISKADAAVYDVLFGKDTGEKDEKGRPILGIFHKMTNEVDKAMEGLNESINSIGKKIKEFFTGKNGIGSWIKKGLSVLGFDVDEQMANLKSTARRYGRRVFSGAKNVAKSIGGDIHNAVMGTMHDMGVVDSEGGFSFGSLFGGGQQVPTHARGTKRVQSAGLTFISPGEAIIPAHLNPWNPNRNTVDIGSQQKNEERLRQQFSSKFKNEFAKLGDAIPTNATGTSNTAAQLIIQQLNRSGLTAKEINSVINAKNDAERNAAIDRVIVNHNGDFEIKQQLSNLERVLTDSRFARAATRLRAGQGVRTRDGKIALRSMTEKGVANALDVDTLSGYNYTALGNIREMMGKEGYQMMSDEEIGQKKFAVREGPTTGIRQGMLQAFGTDPVKAAELSRNYIMKNSFSLAKGGAIGALLSAVFPLGGPLMGSLIGAGVQTLSKSEKFQKYMFGDVVKDKDGNERRTGGLVSRRVMDIFEKYAPDMKKYGITGAIGGLITPFGPLGGAMIGAGASIIKNNKRVNDFFFGDSTGLLNKDRKAAIKKAFPNMGAAMLGTFFLGPFGLLGNAVLGAGIGLVSTTETFKKIMLGAKGRDGIRRGGIAGAIRRQITDPFKNTMMKMGDDIAKWFRDDIVKPVGRGIVPIGKLMGGMVQRGTNNLFNYIARTFTKKGTGIARLADRFLGGVRRAGGLGKWVGKNTVGRLGSAVAGGIGRLGDAAERYAIMNGYGNMYSAKERLNFYDKEGITGTSQVAADQAMADMDEQTLSNNANILSAISGHLNGDLDRAIENQKLEETGYFENDAIKLRDSLEDSSEQRNVMKLMYSLKEGLEKGKYDAVNADEAAREIINAKGISQESKRKLVAMFKQAHGNVLDAEGRRRVAKDKKYLHGQLDNIREQFGLGNISDKDLLKMIPSLSRNLTNEVDVRRYADEEKKSKATSTASNSITDMVNGAIKDENLTDAERASLQIEKEALDSQKKALSISEMMLQELQALNATLMGESVGTVSRTHGMTKSAIDYMRRQNKVTTDRFGTSARILEERNESRRKEYDARFGFNEGGILAGADKDARNTIIDAYDNTNRNSDIKDLAKYLEALEDSRKDRGFKSSIEDLPQVIKLTVEKGPQKTRRILALTMLGFTVPKNWYKDLVDMSETGFMALQSVASVSKSLDSVGSLRDFMAMGDDKEGRLAAKIAMMVANVDIAKGGDNTISNKLGSTLGMDDYRDIIENDAVRKQMRMGASFQDMYDSGMFAGTSPSGDMLNTTDMGLAPISNANKSLKGGVLGAASRFGGHVGNAIAGIGSGIAGGFKAVTPGTTYMRQSIERLGNRAFANYIPNAGTQATYLAAGLTGAAPRSAIQQYMGNMYGYQASDAGQFEAGINSANSKLSADEFMKMSESRQLAYIMRSSEDEISRMVLTAPKDAQPYLWDRLRDLESRIAPPVHAGGLLSSGLSSIGGFLKDAGKSLIGGAFGLDKDGKKLDEEESKPDEAAQEATPHAVMGPPMDVSSIAAVAKAIAGSTESEGASGGITKNADGTMIVPTGTGDIIEYGRSKIDGAYMKSQSKNNLMVEAKIKKRDELQERSVAALEGMAKAFGVQLAGAAGAASKKAGGGLFDMLKDLATAPFKFLDSLPFIGQLGLGAMTLKGIKGLGQFALGKAGDLFAKLPGVSSARKSLGGLINKGGLVGGIADKLFGKFALNPTTVANKGGQLGLDFAGQAAGKSGGWLGKAANAFGKIGGKYGKLAAGVLGAGAALWGGSHLFGGDDNEPIQYGQDPMQVTTRGQMREQGLTDEEINIMQTYAMHGAPPEMAMEAIMARRQQLQAEGIDPNSGNKSWLDTTINAAGNIGGMAAGSFIGRKLLKKHPLIGTILGATIGETAGDALTGGDSPTIGGMIADGATNTVLYNVGNIYRFAKNKLFGGGDEAAKSSKSMRGIVDGFKEYTSKIGGKASSAISTAKSAAETTAKKGAEFAGDAKDAMAKAQPYIEKISDGLKKVYNGAKSFIPDKALPAVSKFFEKILENVVKPANVARAASRIVRQSAALSAGAATLGVGYLAVTAGFAIADFYRGYSNADELFKVKEGYATEPMKIAAGLVSAINGAIPVLGWFLPDDWVLELAVEYIGPVFGFSKEDLDKARAGNDPHESDSITDKISKGVSSLAEDASDLAKKAFSYTPIGMMATFTQKAAALVTGSNYIEDSGKKVTDEEVEQNTQAILGKLKSGASEVFTALQEWLNSNAYDAKDGFIEKLVKESSNPQAIKNAMSKISTKMSSITDLAGSNTSAALVNMPIDTNAAVKAYIQGTSEAGSILDVPPESVTEPMKTLAGVVAAICTGIPFASALVPEEKIVEIAIESIGPALGVDRSKIAELRRKGYGKLRRARDAAVKMTNAFKDKASQIAGSIRETASGVVSSVIDTAKSAGEYVYNKAGELYNGAKDTVASAYNAVKNKASEVYNAAKDTAASAYNTAKDVASSAVSTVGGWVDTARQKAAERLAAFGSGRHPRYGTGGNFYSQLDPMFAMGYNASGDSINQSMYDSGCGPVSASNALSAMGMDVDPRIAAQYALNNGYKEQDGGTMPGFFRDFMGKAGVDAQNVSGTQITDSLKSGNPVVLMGKDGRGENPNNPFAENPHYVTATGMDNNGNIIVQDPESYTPNKVYRASDVISKSNVAIAANRFGTGRRMGVPISRYGKGFRYGRGTDNAEYIWNWLTSQGFSNQAAAGIMGNMQQECSFNPHAYQDGPDQPEAPTPKADGSAGYGLCQWTGSRTKRLIEYARSKGKSSGDLDTQLEYMMIEARESGVIDAMNAAQSPEEAATIWGKDFERCGEMGSRVDYAVNIFNNQGKGITNLSTVSGGPGGQNAPKKNTGLIGKLGEVLDIFSNALTPWAAKSGDSSSSGGSSMSSNANIRKASDWARSVEGHVGHGNNGCTQFVQDYLNQANHPFAKTMSLYVPTLMEQAKEQNMWKESGPSEGDIAVLETNNNRDDGPDHVVIYDGKGGAWGNSSSKNKFLHYDNMLDSFPGGVWGYVNTGDGSSSGDPQSSGNPRDIREVLRDSSLDYGAGKHSRFGMGKFGRAKGVPNSIYSPKLDKDRTKKAKAGRGGMLDNITSMAQKIASPVSNMMSRFGERFKSILAKSSLSPFITKIFGDDNPFLAALGMSSQSSGTSTMQSGPGSTGNIPMPQSGSVVDRLLATIDGSPTITSQFGEPRDGHIYGHGGVDIAGSNDTAPIPTPVDGTVAEVDSEPGGYGNYVQVQDAAGNYHLFAHLSSQSVTNGAAVKAGDIIGNMGNTGASHGAHLHYQVDYPSNKAATTNVPHIDPNSYMPPAGAGKHARFGMGTKAKVSKWGRGWKDDLQNSNSLKRTPKPVGESFHPSTTFGINKFEQMYSTYGRGSKGFSNIEGIEIPDYNRITDDDSIAVQQAKYQRQLILQREQSLKQASADAARSAEMQKSIENSGITASNVVDPNGPNKVPGYDSVVAQTQQPPVVVTDDKLAALIEGQNKTNQLLSAILAVANALIGGNTSASASSGTSSTGAQLNTNTRTQETALSTNVKAILSSLGGGSSVGIGDKLIPSKNSSVNGIESIMAALNSISNR
jgi:hypothetical protein